MKSKLFIIHNVDGISLERAAGPFPNQRQLELAIIKLISRTAGLQQEGRDTAHVLKISSRGNPEFSDLSVGYMQNARWAALGDSSLESPGTWSVAAFALATKKKLESRRKA